MDIANPALFVPLQQMVAGQSGTIYQLMGSPDHVHQLHELGLRGGSRVEMVQSGTPCIIRLDGAKLCFRPSEALRVLVALGEAS